MSPPLSHTLPVYLRIGLLSFGGPAGQIALMQEECVERRGWITPTQFGHGLSIAMVLPGPEAQQLATWIGWRLGGMRGGLAAGLAFILPGAALMIALAAIAAHWGEVPPVAAIFTGIQPAVLLIVARALARIAGKSLSGPADYALAAGAFLGLWALGLPFPLIIAAAAVIGLMRRGGEVADPPGTTSARLSLAPLLLCTILVAATWLLTRTTLGPDPFDGLARLFTTAAFVSFGGAYALLPYVAEHAVETEGWLSAAQMLNGLAIAEATPGPLILVNTYAGYFAGHVQGQGALTATLATFYTFAPSFAMILTLAPHVEAVQRHAWIRRALAGVSAAVVGVVANLTVYLGQAALFAEGLSAPDWPKIALLVAFAPLAFRWKLGMVTLVGLGAAAGLGLLAVGLV